MAELAVALLAEGWPSQIAYKWAADIVEVADGEAIRQSRGIEPARVGGYVRRWKNKCQTNPKAEKGRDMMFVKVAKAYQEIIKSAGEQPRELELVDRLVEGRKDMVETYGTIPYIMRRAVDASPLTDGPVLL